VRFSKLFVSRVTARLFYFGKLCLKLSRTQPRTWRSHWPDGSWRSLNKIRKTLIHFAPLFSAQTGVFFARDRGIFCESLRFGEILWANRAIWHRVSVPNTHFLPEGRGIFPTRPIGSGQISRANGVVSPSPFRFALNGETTVYFRFHGPEKSRFCRVVQGGETRSRFCASQTSAGEAPLAGRAVCSRVERAWGSSAVHLGEVCAVPFASGQVAFHGRRAFRGSNLVLGFASSAVLVAG
jgi:hypothetical protein